MGDNEIRFEMQRAGRMLRAGLRTPTDFLQVPPWERASLARFGEQEPPVGTVLRWVEQNAAATTRVAVRISETAWTDSVGEVSDWHTLARKIGDAPCHVALSWREIPRPEPEPAGDEAVRDWAAQFIPESPSSEIMVERVDDEDGVV